MNFTFALIYSASTNYVHLSFDVLLRVSAPTGSHRQGIRVAFTDTSLSSCSTHISLYLTVPPRIVEKKHGKEKESRQDCRM